MASTVSSSKLPFNHIDQKALKDCEERCAKNKVSIMEKWLILVNATSQRLHLLKDRKLVATYRVSTAEKGTGQEEGSAQTPLGLHQIGEKIGAKADPFAIFSSREDTGKIASPKDKIAYIVGRILWLKGLEKGFNAGKNNQEKCVDSHDRSLYIHGTNDIQNLGFAKSGGCIRMHPKDVIALFEQVPSETPVYIYA